MTQKEVTTILYQQIPDAGRIEVIIKNDKEFCIFKSSLEELYMVCELNENSPSQHSDVFTTIEECYSWIESK